MSATVPPTLLTASTPAGLATAARDVGLGPVLSQPADLFLEILPWDEPEASVARALVEGGHAQTVADLLEDGGFLTAFRRRTGRDGLRWLVGSMRAFLEAERAITRPESTPSASGLSAGMSPAALEDWAQAHHLVGQLDQRATTLQGDLTGAAQRWLWMQPAGLSLRAVLTRPGAGPGSSPLTDVESVPFGVQIAAIAWLEQAAVAVEAARAHARRVRARPSPAPQGLAAVWRWLRELDAELEDSAPAPGDTKGSVHLDPDANALIWRTDASPCQRPPQPGSVTLSLTRPPTLSCACACDGCPAVNPSIIAFIDVLTDPDQAKLQDQLRDLLSTPRWQQQLGILDALLSPSARLPEPDLSLGWLIDADSPGPPTLTPVLCRPKKRGEGWRTWTWPVAEVPAALLVRPGDGRAHRALSLLSAADTGRIDPGLQRATVYRALWALAEHPLVFTGRNRPQPVQLRRVEPALRLVLEPDGGVQMVPDFDGQTWALGRVLDELLPRTADGLVILEGQAGRIRIARIDSAFAGLLEALQRRGNRFPAAGVSALLDRVPALSRHATVHVDPALRGRRVDPDTTPTVALQVLEGAALQLRIRVTPLPGQPPRRPAQGAVEVFGDDGAGRIWCRRDGQEERERASAVVDALGLDPDLATEPWTWFTQDPQEAIELLTDLEAGEIDARVVRSGVGLSVTRGIDAGALSVGVTRKRDWFGLDGAVASPAGTVDLEGLFDAIRRNHRYIQVDDTQWLELTSAFRSQLEALEAVRRQAGEASAVSPLSIDELLALEDAGATVDAPAAWRDLQARVRLSSDLSPEPPPALRATLRPYQIRGFRWLARLATWSGGAVLADDMGLGKTVQALALLLHRASAGPALVVAPTSVGWGWVREAGRFAPTLRFRAYRGPDRAKTLVDLGPGDVLITSWDILARDADILADVSFATCVMDEAHAVKNPTTRRAQAARRVKAGFRLGLTGTPVENRVSELWSLMRVITPQLLGTWERFRDDFATPIERGGSGDRRRALAQLIRPFILRRLKAEVAPELPARTVVTETITPLPAERRRYERARKEAVETLQRGADDAAEAQRMRALAALTRLRQLACHPTLVDPAWAGGSAKLERVRTLVDSLRAEGHKALIFSQFTSHLGLVRAALEADGAECRYLDGSTPARRRREEVDAFQQGSGDVFLISLKAGGVGLTLTAATYVLHLDPWWNPAVEDQATDRAHRIGQTQPVTVYRLVTAGTVEEAVLSLHAEKRALVAGLLHGTGAAGRMNVAELEQLIAAGSVWAPTR